MTSILNRAAFAVYGKKAAFSGICRSISTIQKPNYAFAFDIDGVLIKVTRPTLRFLVCHVAYTHTLWMQGKRRIPEATR